MRHVQSTQLLAALLLTTRVTAHGHVTNIVINGVSYRGWNIDSDPYNPDPPVVVAWQTPNTANGFISPDAYGTNDIICHLNATNARGHAVVAAGDKIFIQWTAWPDSHHGPVIDYLARCGSSCETVDKTTLEFFKIDGVGLVDGSNPPGVWGDDQLIADNNSWLVEIPPTIAPGYYVLRHELIALHGAGSQNGAQNYPQCFNLQITGSGTAQPSGVKGTELYSPTDPGILVNIYNALSTYIVPGPTLIPGAVSVVQSSSTITASGTPGHHDHNYDHGGQLDFSSIGLRAVRWQWMVWAHSLRYRSHMHFLQQLLLPVHSNRLLVCLSAVGTGGPRREFDGAVTPQGT
ncbi:hypothetical protein KXX11_007185 [Aspergillus fumigatus]|nr:hypothetical protein KXX11_007185 [Aspergillus fumigatus]